MQLRWAKVADADATTGTSGTWNLFYADQTATGLRPAPGKNAGTAFSFNGSGQLTAPTGTSLSIPDVTVNGTKLGAVTLDFGTAALTQYGAAAGQVTTNTLQQNGYAAGTLNSLAVTSDGKLTGTYSNGNSVALAQVGVARFNAPNSLKAVSGGGNYAEDGGIRRALTGLAGGTIIGGNVEQSNTDTAGEFSKLIVTSRPTRQTPGDVDRPADDVRPDQRDPLTTAARSHPVPDPAARRGRVRPAREQPERGAVPIRGAVARPPSAYPDQTDVPQRPQHRDRRTAGDRRRRSASFAQNVANAAPPAT